MYSFLLTLFVLILTLPLQAGELRTLGPVELQKAGPFDDDKITKLSLEDRDISVKIKLRADEFVGDYAVFAVPSITSKASQKLDVSYHTAFFDAGGNLLASVSQTAEVEPGSKDFQLGSALTPLPKSVVDRITAYQIVIHTTPAQ